MFIIGIVTMFLACFIGGYTKPRVPAHTILVHRTTIVLLALGSGITSISAMVWLWQNVPAYLP